MKNVLKSLLALVLICCFLVLSWYDVVYGMWDHDSGYYLLTSYLMNLDFKAFIDFPLQYPPLMIQINAILLKLGVSHENAVISIPLFWIYANGALTFITSFRHNRSLLSSAFYVLLYGLVSVENGGNHVTLEQGIIFFTLVATNIAESKRYFVKYEKSYYIAIGFLVGCIVLVKQVGILLVPYILLLTFDQVSVRKDLEVFLKKSLFILLGVLTICLAVFIRIGATYEIVFSQLFHRIASYVSNSPDSKFSIVTEFQRSPFTVHLILFLLLMVAMGMFFHGSDKLQKLKVFCLLSASIAYLAARSIRNYPHYTLNVWAPFLLIGLNVIPTMLLSIKEYAINRTQFIFSYMFLISLVASISLTVYKKPSNFYQYSEIKDFFIPSSQAIREMTTDQRRMLQLGEEPILEFLTYKIPQRLDYEWAWNYDKYAVIGNPTVIINNFNRVEEVQAKEQALISSGYKNVFTSFSGSKQQPNRILNLWIKN